MIDRGVTTDPRRAPRIVRRDLLVDLEQGSVPYEDKHPARLAVKVTPGYSGRGAYVRCGRFEQFSDDTARAIRRTAKKVRRLEAEAQRLEGAW